MDDTVITLTSEVDIAIAAGIRAQVDDAITLAPSRLPINALVSPSWIPRC
jgi:hypothetical protein